MVIKVTKNQISGLRKDKHYYELYEQSSIISQNANVLPYNNDV